MTRYVAQRLLWAVPLLLVVTAIVFAVVRVAPGDPVLAALGEDVGLIDPEVYAALRAELGLDQPLPVQYFGWLWSAMRLDFGTSLWTRQPIGDEILSRLGVTLELSILAFGVVLLAAIPLGVLSAVHRNQPLDQIIRVFAVIGLSIPNFWFGLLILMALVTLVRWIPPLVVIPFWENPAGNLAQFIWPALAIAVHPLAITLRIVRTSLLEVLAEDYIRTARSKGLEPRTILYIHGLKNALPSILATLGLVLASLLTGTIILETVFNLPGVGRYLIDGLTRRDYPTVQAIVILMSVLVVLTNIAVDVAHAWVDPRIRRSG